jgi:hypothetical protein
MCNERQKINNPMGGFLSLDFPKRKNILYSNCLKFQSARSALIFLLMKNPPRMLYLPDFICDELIVACIKFGIKISFYNLNEDLLPNGLDNINKKDLILYINYFGVCNKNVKILLSKFIAKQIIIDNSQAFFERPLAQVYATIYSPRKFFGLPDGGILQSKFFYKKPDEKDLTSILRFKHLLMRANGSSTESLYYFRQSERSLSENLEPKEMSELTLRIYNSINFTRSKELRANNFYHLHKSLSKSNLLIMEDAKLFSPLCYPYMIDQSKAIKLRRKLIKNNIFLPMFWKTELKYPKSKISEILTHSVLPIPIDHRLKIEDMNHILKILNA